MRTSTSNTPAQSSVAAELAKFINKTGVPAAGAGLIDEQGILLLEYAGQRGRDDPVPVEREDQWHIGSCTKTMTAMLFGLLVDQGKVSWQTTLSEVFTDNVDSMHPDWLDTPFDELFYCRSGMAANPSLAFTKTSWQNQRPLTEQRTELVRNVLAKPPRNRGKFRYSNLGYATIGAAIDRISAMSYEDALQSLLLTPLGIRSAGFGPPPKIKGHAALLCSPWLNLFKGKACDPNNVKSDNPAVFSSAGTLHISLPDWAKFLSVLLVNKTQNSIPETVIESVFEAPTEYQMSRGLGRVTMPEASFAMQGSNTMWVATAMLNKQRDKIAFVTCNDGRSSLYQASALLALTLLELDLPGGFHGVTASSDQN